MAHSTGRNWTDFEHKEDEMFEPAFIDEEAIVPPSEVKIEHMLEARLAMDAVDMGTLPGADYRAWNEHKRHSTEFFTLGEGASLATTSSASGSMRRSDSQKSLRSMRDEMTSPVHRMARVPSLQRLRTSASTDRLDGQDGPHSPRSSDTQHRRSSNLSQMINTLKKSPSMDFHASARTQRDENTHSPPPPPPKLSSDGTTTSHHVMGPRRQSNLAVMRVIAESM